MYRFNMFTSKSNEIINHSIKYAEALGHNYIGSEHLLVGLFMDDECKAVFESFSIYKSRINDYIIDKIGVGERTKLYPYDFTPRTKRIIELSYQISKSFGNYIVEPKSILISILNEDDCFATKYLLDNNINVTQLIEELSNNKTLNNQVEQQNTKKKSKSKLLLLDEYAVNLNELAIKGDIDPVINRDEEIKRIIQILMRRRKNNPCLIGEAGVGKTAIVEGLALNITRNKVPNCLLDKKIYSLNINSIVSGTKYRGDFEERLKKIIDEVSNNNSIILFVDEIHTIMSAGSAEGAIDAANILKPYLARGELQLIGATTLNEYRKILKRIQHLKDAFSV